MHRFQLLLWLSLTIGTHSAFAQTSEKVLNCAADHLHERLRLDDRFYRQRELKLEAEWSDYAKKGRKSQPPPYTLPIVFHIVHDNGPENISDADIIRSLEFTNQAFANTDYYDQGTGVNTQVQFCLARRSPDNQPTTGINRVVSAEFTDLEATAEDRDMKDLSRWEPREYVNVWVVKEICGLGFGCGVAGYAYYPGAHGGSVDGIVVEARWLTTNEARASVLVHELGHYLGIRHTFDGGCTNDDCTLDGDRVCDTPPDQSKAAVPCSGTANSCTTDTDSGFATDQNDMFINYMDYGYWSCYSAFTQGQADRMHFFLDGTRRSLLTSPGCVEPCPSPAVADFTGGDVTVEIGTTINFVNTSTNGNGFTWKINDLPEATSFNFSRLFDTEGNFTVTLLAGGNPPLCFPDSLEQRVRVVCSLTAGFDPAGTTTAGEERTFTNLSTLADTYTWRLDGTPISTDEDLTFTFASPGLYNLCLEASNPWCGEEFCRLVFVRQPPDTTGNPGSGDCGESFVYGYQSPFGEGQDGSLTTVIPDGSGGYFTAGYYGRQALVMHIGEDGSILWQTNLFPSGLGNTVSKLILDADGNLAGIGRNNAATPGTVTSPSFVFKLNPTDGSLLWGHNLSFDFGSLRVNDFVQAGPGTLYTMVGEVGGNGTAGGGQNGFILQLSPADGFAIGGLRLFFTEGEATFDRIIWHSNRNRFFVSGKQLSILTPGWLLLAFDANANLINGTVFPTGDPTNTTSALTQDDDQTVFTTSSLNSSGAPNDIHVYRIDGSDNLTLSTVIATASLQILTNLETTASGYLISSLSSPGQILFELNRSGAMNWSRSYDLGLRSSVGFNFHPTEIAADGGILLAGDRFATTVQIPAVLKLNADGTAAADCISVTDFPATPLPRQPDRADWFGQAEDIQLIYESFGWEPSFLEPAGGNCREECPEEDECADLFYYNYDPNSSGFSGFTSIISDGEGGYYVGGQAGSDATLMHLSEEGSINWQTEFQLTGINAINSLSLDNDGNLFGTGVSNTNPVSFIPTSFVFQVDPSNGVPNWLHTLEIEGALVRAIDIAQAGPGTPYTVVGDINLTQNSNSFIVQLDQNNGLTIGDLQEFPSTSNNRFSQILWHPDRNAFVVLEISSGNIPAILFFDPTGIFLEGTRMISLQSFNARAVIDRDNDQIVLVAEGRIPGSADRTIELYRFGLDNSLNMAISLLPNEEFLIRNVVVNDAGYVINGVEGTGQTLIQVDRSGEINWSYNYDISLENSDVLFLRNLAASPNGNILLAGEARFGFSSPALLSISSGGDVASCINAANRELTTQTPQPFITSWNRQPTNHLVTYSEIAWGRGASSLSNESCREECEEPVEICDNQIDDDGDGLIDCQDDDLSADCCCLPDPTISLGNDADFCGPVLRNFTAARFDTLFLFGNTADTIYPNPTINGLVRLQFTEPGVYRLLAIDTCGRTAADTLTLHPRSRPSLDIGPDTTLCSNAVIPLRAQPGFAEYEWVDGTAEQEFTAFDEGVYWVRATDSCGQVQADTMRVFIDPATAIELGPDTLICPGDTLTFSLSGFTEYQWSQSTYISCTTCPTVRFAPTSDTLLVVAATQGLGCIASDSIRIRMTSTAGQNTPSVLCAGDSLMIGNQTITSSGVYLDTVDVGNCFRIDTVTVNMLRDTVTRDTVQICAGDSTQIFGNFEDTAGAYRQNFLRANGCDSLHEQILIVNDTSWVSETLQICAGDSALIFGTYRMQPGAYSSVTSNSTGCDSTTQIVLEVNELLINTNVVRSDCENTNAGALEVQVDQGSPPYSIIWTTGDTTLTIDQLSPGTYGVTVTDALGCSATSSTTIQMSQLSSLMLTTIPDGCSGSSGGSISISGSLAGVSLSMAGQPGQGPTFSNLPAGEYLITAIDSIGCERNFTVDVPQASSIELGPDTLICPGDTLTFSLSGFSNYQWSQSSYLDCTTCPEVRFAPDQDTLLVVAATQGPGCIASDSIRVRVANTSGSATSSDLCSGDTLSIGNQIITTGGIFFDTIPSGDCFRVDTVTVSLLQDTLIRDTVRICAGDSILIFGDFRDTPGTYSQSFPRSNGCDSIRESLLVVNDTVLVVETISICAGDSALIFGQFETQPGPYFSVESTAAGCDSTTRINLEVSALAISTRVNSNTCTGAGGSPGAFRGAGEVVINSGMPPYSITWTTGDTTTAITALSAGTYGVTVTDANGCSATASLTIVVQPPPVITLTTTDETCPEAQDGTLTVAGELNGQELSIPGLAGPGPVYTGIPPGDYVLEVTDSLGCDQSFPFTIAAATGDFLQLPLTLTVDFGDSITLTPNTSATDLSLLTWTSAEATLCVGCPTLTLRPLTDQTIVATLPGTAGCPVSDTTQLSVIRENLVYIPNAFSPNADGVNDVFRIYPGGAVEEILRFAVYDRWGGQVFLRENALPTDALAGWDGTLPNSKDPSIGVYVYVVEVRLFTGEVVKLAGEVMVVR